MPERDDPSQEENTEDRTLTAGGPERPSDIHASLVVIHGERLGERIRLDIGHPLVIGRAPDCDLQLTQSSVSRRHCQLFRDGDRYRIRDLGATNRTSLNEQPVIEAWLTDGDHITIGQSILKFVAPGNLEAHYHAEVHQRSILDNLTGLYNRRYFLDMLDREIARNERHKRVFSLAILDLDLFKQVNDDLGHLAGDEILKTLGYVLRNRVRRNDTAARIGGEEFGVLLPETELADALELAEDIRRAVGDHEFRAGDRPIELTASLGVAQWRPEMAGASDILRAADEALYEAKDAGRDRVRAAGMGRAKG